MRGSIEIQPAETDTGIAQIDSLRLDEAETARRAHAFYRTFDARVTAEAAFLKALSASVVVGDVPPLAFAAARRVNVTSIAVANFTWDWIYAGYARFSLDAPPVDQDRLEIPTTLTEAQVRNSFSTPETVSFWQLPSYIRSSESSGFATAGYRLQYHKLLAQPFLLAAMVMLAASVSLRFFRMGGVQRMVLSGVGAGFLLYVLSKVTEDLSKAELMHPIAAAWLPVLVGGLTGFLALLYQEDG